MLVSCFMTVCLCLTNYVSLSMSLCLYVSVSLSMSLPLYLQCLQTQNRMSRGAACDCSGSWTTIGAVEPSVTTSRTGKLSESLCRGDGAEPVESVARFRMVPLLVLSVGRVVKYLWWLSSVKHLRLGFGLEVGNGAFGVPAFMC